MIRIGSARSALQIPSKVVAVSKRPISSSPRALTTALNRHVAATRVVSRAVPARLPSITQQTSFATKTPKGFQQGIDPEEEQKIAQRKLKPHPESVTTESSVRHVFEPSPPGQERPVQQGVSHDLKVVQETFSLSGAPNEPYWLGLAGTLPYLGTSISTVYLAWVLNTPWPSPSTFANSIMVSQETASQLLATLEPIQLGYGAVIISFLGAIHWGLEYAEKVPEHARTRFRYGIGVMAPIFAWPTLFMPVEFALTSQFAAFTALYFADARAAVRGWAPAWYSTYRFALTAVVGVSIAISLIGRAKVGDASPRLTGLSEKFHEHRGEEEYTQKWQEREQKEIEKVKKQEKEAEKKRKEEEKQQQQEEAKSKGKSKDQKDQGKQKEQEKSKDQGKSNEDGGDKQDSTEEKDGKK
ncbi:hypothetical protein ANO14919_116850 [Xylariales sp. No.14919]|nr:hypothetical protein ANO14919_116850 [Xylariales sp. No.14919]